METNCNKLDMRDIVKLAFQYQETENIPYRIILNKTQEKLLMEYYGTNSLKGMKKNYFGFLTSVDIFLLLGSGRFDDVDYQTGFVDISKAKPKTVLEDKFGCKWKMGNPMHIIDYPLKEPEMRNFKMPDLEDYFEKQLKPRWEGDFIRTEGQFRILFHAFGLFERSWSLRGFENFLMDLIINKKFAEQLLDTITEWTIKSINLMAQCPIDAIFLGDDHSGQRGMLMGADRWRDLFKPRWKKIFDCIHHYGLYSIMHICGDTSEVIPDLIEIGLDCVESCQPEAMDIYKLKREYGKDLRFWGGLGCQSTLTFGTPEEVTKEVKKLKNEMGKGGGYVLGPSKPPLMEAPLKNISAFLEEANKARI